MPGPIEPVIETSDGVGWPTTSAAGLPVAETTLKHARRQDLAAISASSTVLTGVVSDGLRTTVLPAAIAGAIFQTAITIG